MLWPRAHCALTLMSIIAHQYPKTMWVLYHNRAITLTFILLMCFWRQCGKFWRFGEYIVVQMLLRLHVYRVFILFIDKIKTYKYVIYFSFVTILSCKRVWRISIIGHNVRYTTIVNMSYRRGYYFPGTRYIGVYSQIQSLSLHLPCHNDRSTKAWYWRFVIFKARVHTLKALLLFFLITSAWLHICIINRLPIF